MYRISLLMDSPLYTYKHIPGTKMIADIISRPSKEIVSNSETLSFIDDEAEFLAAGIFSGHKVDYLGLADEELIRGQLQDPDIKIIVDILNKLRSSRVENPAATGIGPDLVSKGSEGPEKEPWHPDERSISERRKVLHFIDLPQEERSILLKNIAPWFIPIANELVLMNGVLYRIEYISSGSFRLNQNVRTELNIQVVLPKRMIPGILKLFHEHLALGIHASFERTLWKVRKFCIFENMASTIKEFVNNCDLCNRANTKKIKPPLGKNIVPEMPFLVWALDGAGPFPITSSGNRYVLVGVDLFSSLVVLKCIPAMNAENTIKFLWENIIAYYGLPEAVLTDHGSNFDNIEIKKMFSEINCKKIYSSPYNPQCNGASENKVKILKKILSHSCGKLTQVDWDEKIPLIMLSMNSSLNTVRKFSSFTIVHGFSGKSLADLQFNKPTNLNYFDGYDSYVTRLIQNICEIHQTCLNEIKIQRSKQAIQYNKDSKETLIASGDIVYCRDTTSVGRKSTNYSFRGPYVVLSEVHKNVFYLASLNPGELRKRTSNARLLKKVNHEIFLKHNPQFSKNYQKEINQYKEKNDEMNPNCDVCSLEETVNRPYDLRSCEPSTHVILNDNLPLLSSDIAKSQKAPSLTEEDSFRLSQSVDMHKSTIIDETQNNLIEPENVIETENTNVFSSIPSAEVSRITGEPTFSEGECSKIIPTVKESEIMLSSPTSKVKIKVDQIKAKREENPFYSLRKLK